MGFVPFQNVMKKKPYHLKINEHEYCVDYEPAESKLPLFGGGLQLAGSYLVSSQYAHHRIPAEIPPLSRG